MPDLPLVVRAEYRCDYRIRLEFDDGVQGEVDFVPWLSGPAFEPLKNPAFFRRFHVEAGTVVWPNGADIAPETLHRAARSGGVA